MRSRQPQRSGAYARSVPFRIVIVTACCAAVVWTTGLVPLQSSAAATADQALVAKKNHRTTKGGEPKTLAGLIALIKRIAP